MPLDFPTSPSLNQTYTFGGRTWKWNGTGWQLESPLVTTASIQDAAVTTAKIADGAITTAKIANGAVAPADLSTGGPSWDTSGNQTVTGNVTLSGAGKSFRGDFSNATVANRVWFQSTTTNDFTVVGALPNGTSTASAFMATNNSTPTNASIGSLIAGSASVILESSRFGTGTYLPLAFQTGGSERARIDTSGRLLVGTSTARNNFFNDVNNTHKLQIEGTDYTAGLSLINNNTSISDGTNVVICKSAGASVGSNVLVRSGETLGGVAFLGNDGSEFVTAASINASIDGTPGANDMPGRLTFSTTADGSATQTERMRIDSAGRLLVGTSATRTNMYGASYSPAFQVETAGTFTERTVSFGYSGNDNGGAILTLLTSRGTTVGSNTLVQSDDEFGKVSFTGTDGAKAIPGAQIAAYVDGTPGTNDMPGRLAFLTTADGASASTERMRITSAGAVGVNHDSTTGSFVGSRGFSILYGASSTRGGFISGHSDIGLFVNRAITDGNVIEIRQDDITEGAISVSGTTVTYGGGHLARWSQLPNDGDPSDLLKGTVMSNLDEMCEWGEEDNEQLNKTKVSDVEGDANVAGVFVSTSFDENGPLDFFVAMTGDMIIRIADGVTVQRGDLLMSAGDGTAKPQGDDIVRSKTVAKVTSTNVTCTYDDGSYCVPCVLMAC